MSKTYSNVNYAHAHNLGEYDGEAGLQGTGEDSCDATTHNKIPLRSIECDHAPPGWSRQLLNQHFLKEFREVKRTPERRPTKSEVTVICVSRLPKPHCVLRNLTVSACVINLQNCCWPHLVFFGPRDGLGRSGAHLAGELTRQLSILLPQRAAERPAQRLSVDAARTLDDVVLHSLLLVTHVFCNTREVCNSHDPDPLTAVSCSHNQETSNSNTFCNYCVEILSYAVFDLARSTTGPQNVMFTN